jgi:hypothetical protein
MLRHWTRWASGRVAIHRRKDLVGAKTWKDIWSAGHGVGSITEIPSVDELVVLLRRQFETARAKLTDEPWSHNRHATRLEHAAS